MERLNVSPKVMDGCERCPRCQELPEANIDLDVVELSCVRHGYIARGKTIEQAVDFWNLYIAFVNDHKELGL